MDRFDVCDIIQTELEADNLTDEVRWVAEHIHGLLSDKLPEMSELDRNAFLESCTDLIKGWGTTRMSRLASEILRIVEHRVTIKSYVGALSR